MITNWFLQLVMKQHRSFFWEQLDNLKSQGGMHLLSDIAWKDGESLGFLGQQPHEYAADWKALPRLYYHWRVVLPPKSMYTKIVCTECHVPSSYATRATNTIWLTSFYWLHLATYSYTELCFDQAPHLGDLHWTHWLIPSPSFGNRLPWHHSVDSQNWSRLPPGGKHWRCLGSWSMMRCKSTRFLTTQFSSLFGSRSDGSLRWRWCKWWSRETFQGQ